MAVGVRVIILELGLWLKVEGVRGSWIFQLDKCPRF